MGNKVCMFQCIPIRRKKRNISYPTPLSNNNNNSSTLDNFFEKHEITIPTPLPIEGLPFYNCQICYESKPLNDSFCMEDCTHFYCTKCTIKYIVSKLQDNKVNLNCPESGCSGTLNPQDCKPILPKNVLDRWEKGLSESVIPETNKYYCPFYDCSSLLISDDDLLIECSCPHCKRRICVKCKSPWHDEISCENFQKMKDSNDVLMLDLAKRRKWQNCPKCKNLIEKSHGCNHMQCRCSYRFCYQCQRDLTKKSECGH